MRVLCNLPLECFDDRAAMAGIELCTYGPADRMRVDGEHFPFDVVFDPSRGTWDELQAALPRGFRPDLVLVFWPDQEPLPVGLERCPVPVVGVISDYNLTLPTTASLQPFFDVLLCDRAGTDVFAALGHEDVRWFCQYAHKKPFHHLQPDVPRDLDLAFAGNLNPAVQRERAPWIARLCDLRQRGVAVEVRQGLFGLGYGRFLNRARLGWNRSVRGEMNLRAFEVPACGALLLMERENLEVRDFFAPGEECVLYGDDDFEDVVLGLLADEPRRQRIAAAGHRRVQDHALGKRLPPLLERLATAPMRRARVDSSAALLGRATAMLTTWASGPALVDAALQAVRALPASAAAHNVLAVADLRWRGAAAAPSALQVLRRALELDLAHVPAACNLAELLATGDRPELHRRAADLAAERLQRAEPGDLLGPVLPLGFAAGVVDWSLALQEVLRGHGNAALVRVLDAARRRQEAGRLQFAGTGS